MTGVDERHESPQHRSLATRALGATSSFFAGFALQIVTLTGYVMADKDDGSRWFARGEWAAYGFLALLAALGLAILVSHL